MRLLRWGRSGLLAIGAALLFRAPARAQSPGDSAAVEQALAHYTGLVRRMDSDSIAALFTPDGLLVNPGGRSIRGPEAIREFLLSFRAFHVLADTMTAAQQVVRGDTAVQRGTFWQQVRVPAGDTVVARGRFELVWVRLADGSWRIRRLGTVPEAAGGVSPDRSAASPVRKGP